MACIKQVVPWFDKQEWEEVYKLSYSMNLDLQRKAYQHMSVWRARVSNLCMGVEYTQACLHLLLCESKKREDGSPAFEEADLQPMYSNTIMRFLNHLQNFCDNKTTLYQMADNHGIPGWIVNLRHETAHGDKLPPLCLLRDSFSFIFEWLNEKYWLKEMSRMMDVVLSYARENLEITVEKLLEIWKCVKLFLLGGFKTISDVPNNGELSVAISELQQLCSPYKEYSLNTCINLNKISSTILLWISEILEDKNINKQLTEKLFISKLLGCQSFLPSINPHNKIDMNRVIKILLNIWKEIIVKIQNHGLMLKLLHALFEITNDSFDPRQKVAALWIRYLASSLSFKNSDKLLKGKLTFSSVIILLNDKLSSPLCSSEVVQYIINDSYKSFKNSLPLQPLSYVDRSNVQQFVKEPLMSPSKTTSIFISSLLDLLEPPLDPNNKLKLCKLVKLFTKDICTSEEIPEDIVTLEMLSGNLNNLCVSMESLKEIENEVDFEEKSLDNSCEGIWTMYSGTENWSKCPLGRTPWQEQNFLSVPV